MAYFSNSMEGASFDVQCAVCKYGDKPCPIALLQITYNYSQIGNDLARKMLSDLIDDSGNCAMYDTFKEDFNNNDMEDKVLLWPKIETIADKIKQDYVRENWERIMP